MRREGYVFLIAVLAVFGLFAALLLPQSMAKVADDERYAVVGGVVSEVSASGSFLTSQIILAAVAVAVAAATAGILVYDQRKL